MTAVKNEIHGIDWSNLETETDTNKKVIIFYEKLNKAFENCVPKISINKKAHKFPKWWNYCTIKMFKKKERLRKIKRKSASQLIEYAKLRKLIKKEIKQDYNLYVDRITNKIKINSKEFWNFYNDKKNTKAATVLTYDGKTLSDPQSIADAFANHFIRSYNNTPSQYSPNFNQESDNFLHVKQISEEDVRKEILAMTTNKPPGPDGIPPLVYKKCCEALKRPLANIMSSSLQTKTFPQALKESIITPVPKKTSSEISDFRPVSNLNVIAKLFEGILYSAISTHVFNIVAPEQHGFVNKRSTVSNLLEFCDYTAKAMSNSQVDVIYTDVLKCFDQISHDAIIDALIKSGFSEPLVLLFMDYLRNRHATVKYGKTFKSQPFIPPSGIGQGSKLSSLLFILTYNDIHRHIRHSQYKLYADDLKIFKTIDSIDDCLLLQEDIHNAQTWLGSIGLRFHPEKCTKITFTNKKINVNYTYHIDNLPIKQVDHTKDLGITIQSDLTWNMHIEDAVNRAYKKLGCIIRHCVPIYDMEAIIMLYKSIVRSTLQYGSEVWIPKTKIKFKLLERVQARFIRYLFCKFNGFYPKYPHYIAYNTLIENLPIDSLEEIINSKQTELLKKILNNRIESTYLLNQISLRIPDNRLRNCPNKDFFSVPHPRDLQAHKSPIVAAMYSYNKAENRPDIFCFER
ncbi:hypothetical protein WDU94_000614 [Cyamophila willieti]